MVKAFKESHAKDVEKLAADRVREAEKKAKDNAVSTPKHTVLSMAGQHAVPYTQSCHATALSDDHQT